MKGGREVLALVQYIKHADGCAFKFSTSISATVHSTAKTNGVLFVGIQLPWKFLGL